RVQADLHLVVAGGLDVAGQLDAAPVEVGTAGRGDRRGDLGRRDRAEQPAGVARAGAERVRLGLKRGLDLGGVTQIADLPGRAGPLDLRDLLLRALGPRDRIALGQQVVTAVAVLDLHHVAGGAEAGDLLGEDDLHVLALPQRDAAE